MLKSSNVVCALFGIAGACATASADFSDVTDRNRDGYINVIDVAAELGLGGLIVSDRAPVPLLSFEEEETFAVPGGEVRVLVLIDALFIPLFGYSLDVDVAPVMGATGSLVPSVSETNFFDERNLISAGGAMRDGFFSVIQLSADDGIFVTTNTADASAVLATAGVNDVLVELVFDASNDALGSFEISFGPASALANEDGMAVPFEFVPATVSILEPVVSGQTYYEMGDLLDTNDIFDAREVFSVADPFISYVSGKLQEDRDPGRYPDTYLFMFDKDDNILCEDNDSSNKGNGKASACFDVAPVPNGEDGGATVRLGITGRADGVDPLFNGLFFNAPHGQLGEAEVCVTYYAQNGDVIGTDTYLCTFVTGAEAFRVNYVVPEGTVSVDVEIDNTTETFPICADVDYYEINALEATSDYVITVVGGTLHDDGGRCEILAWFDKLGRLVYPIGVVSSERNGGDTGQGAQLSVIADVNGRVRLAVSGAGDENFDGWLDDADGNATRSIETPGYEPPPAHGCCSCYTLKIESVKGLTPGGEIPIGEGVGLMLANGDLNVDGSVNVIDLAMMLNNWGWTAP